MKKIILLITAVFICADHSAFANSEYERASIKRNALISAQRKLTVAVAIKDRIEGGRVSALELKQCIFWAYNSTPYLEKPSGYTAEPTSATTETPAEMSALKKRCKHAVSAANRKKSQTDDLLAQASTIETDAKKGRVSVSAYTNLLNVTISEADRTAASSALAELEASIAAEQEKEQEQAKVEPYCREIIKESSFYSHEIFQCKNVFYKVPEDKRIGVLNLLKLLERKTDQSRRDDPLGIEFIVSFIKRCTAAIPSDQFDEVAEKLKLFTTDDMRSTSVIRISNDIIAIPADKRIGGLNLFKLLATKTDQSRRDDPLSIADMTARMKNIGAIPANQLSGITDVTKIVITDDMSAVDVDKIVNKVGALPASNLSKIASLLKFVVTKKDNSRRNDPISIDDMTTFMQNIGAIPANQLDEITKIAKIVVTDKMSAVDAYKIANKVVALPASNLSKIGSLLQLVVTKNDNSRRDNLFNIDSITTFIERIGAVPTNQLKNITTCVERLILNNTSTIGAYEIANGIIDLSESKKLAETANALVKFMIEQVPGKRQAAYAQSILSTSLKTMQDQWLDIYQKTNIFMTESMNDKSAVDIIKLISGIPADKRDAVVAAIKQVTHTSADALRADPTSALISEVCKLAKNKTTEEWTELMGKITARLTDELTLPQAVEIMKNPDAAPDAVSDTVRDRGA